MQRPMRFAFLTALILCWGVSLATAQAPGPRPSISEEISPVEEVSVETQDGQRAIAVLRRPPGLGPFPAVVIAYPFNVSRWKALAVHNSTMTRFLAAGYVTVMTTWSGWSGSDSGWEAALSSTLAIVDHVKNMSDVDPNSVVLYGCSAGGHVALKVAAATEVAAITVEDPNMFGYDISLTTLNDWFQLNEDPHRFYTPEVRRLARERLRRISGPIFFAQGGASPIARGGAKTTVNEIILPDLKAAGNEVEVITYAGQKHCFGFFAVAERGVANDGDKAASRFFTDMDAFFKRHLPTQPVPVADSLVEKVKWVLGDQLKSAGLRVERIELSPEVLADYVGTYEPDEPLSAALGFVEDVVVIVTLEDNQLMVEARLFIGQLNKGPLFAATETDFFFDPQRSGTPEFEFVRGEDGMVTHVIVRTISVTLSKQLGR